MKWLLLVLLGGLLVVSEVSLARDLSDKSPIVSSQRMDPSVGNPDLSVPITWESVMAVEKRIEVLKQLGRKDEAEELESRVKEWKKIAVSTPERVSVPEGALGGAVSASPSSGPILASAPWGTDAIIYQGSYSYDGWATIDKNQPFSVDYDSLGNLYAAVSLASDSSIHLYQSTDNGVTWVDRYNFLPTPSALNTNIQLLVSDDGDSALAYIFYLWTGGSGNNLWCRVVDMSTWSFLRNALLDSAMSDTIVDFTATRDHWFGEAYYLYVDYQKRLDDQTPLIYFTRSTDHGGTWSTPIAMQNDCSSPSNAFGGYSVGTNLYRVYTFQPNTTSSSIRARRSLNYGGTWDPSIQIYDGASGDGSDPRIAAAHTASGTQLAWTTFTLDLSNSGNYDIWASYTTDGGSNWTGNIIVSAYGEADEYGSNMHVHRSDGNSTFHLAYIYDDTVATAFDSIRVLFTDSTTWNESASLGINDSAFAHNVRPLPTYSGGILGPGVAYGGFGGVNVYYDNAWYTGVEESPVEVRGLRFELRQNYPNPFTSGTTLEYSLPISGKVSLKIYDITGRLVRTLVEGEKDAGLHTVSWDGRDKSGSEVPPGIYFSRFTSGPLSRTKKLILIH